MTLIPGQFRKKKIEKKKIVGEREMVEDAISKKEIDRVGRRENKLKK